MNKTIEYYNKKANEYTADTQNVDFSELQNAFTGRLKPGAHILDLGCGSGRDSKSFIDKGYRVTSVDGSEKLADIACRYIGRDVICSTFQDYEPAEIFDGIWACASLLHLPIDELKDVMSKISEHLTADGYMYASFKYGTFSGERNGRYFIDMTEDRIKDLINKIPLLEIEELTLTEDVRPNRKSEKWLNVFLVKK